MNLPDNHIRLPGVDFESYGYHDYGDRRFERARAFVFHGAESALSNEWAVTNYLRKEHGPNPNGVSATFAIEVNGKKGQMLGLNRTSGSIRASLATSGPRLCREDGPFYGYRHAKGALRDWWGTFVNSAVWSVETGMQARLGPNDAVADSAVELFLELYDYNKGDLIPLGHGDFAHCYKGCPGTTAAVKEMFRRMGGHGLDFQPPAKPHPVPDLPAKEVRMSTVQYVPGELATIRSGAELFDYPGGSRIGTVGSPAPLERPSLGTSPDGGFRLITADFQGDDGVFDRTGWVRSADVEKVRVADPDARLAAVRAKLRAVREAAENEAASAEMRLGAVREALVAAQAALEDE